MFKHDCKYYEDQSIIIEHNYGIYVKGSAFRKNYRTDFKVRNEIFFLLI